MIHVCKSKVFPNKLLEAKKPIPILPEGPVGAKVLPEGVLLHIERGTLSTQAGHLDGLQRRYLLLD